MRTNTLTPVKYGQPLNDYYMPAVQLFVMILGAKQETENRLSKKKIQN
jgi:hypothetical protein